VASSPLECAVLGTDGSADSAGLKVAVFSMVCEGLQQIEKK